MIIGSLHGIRRPTSTAPGLCSKVSDPDVFVSDDPADIREAKLMCAICPIRQECFADAMQSPGQVGVRGGLTWNERRSVKRGIRAVAGPKSCDHCARPFMPVRDSRFCDADCWTAWKKLSKASRARG